MCCVVVYTASLQSMTRGYKKMFMLNLTEHEISTAHKKTKIPTNKKCIALSLSEVAFNM